MTLDDVIVARNLSDHELVAALPEVLLVTSNEVLVLDDIEEGEVGEHVKVLCVRTRIKGDFPIVLSIYLRDPALENVDREVVLSKFCSKLGCTCPISDDSMNPYSRLLIVGSEPPRPVFLDADRLDADEEEYVLDTRYQI
ncbi:MAG: hypothetical protein M3437_06805 [Chloroflexota bacterium]|nr:hypothetical protein [Chloroflexota bacterium]MDQ5866275.1 hypothetical protein [Chloroflexota bacterium]